MPGLAERFGGRDAELGHLYEALDSRVRILATELLVRRVAHGIQSEFTPSDHVPPARDLLVETVGQTVDDTQKTTIFAVLGGSALLTRRTIPLLTREANPRADTEGKSVGVFDSLSPWAEYVLVRSKNVHDEIKLYGGQRQALMTRASNAWLRGLSFGGPEYGRLITAVDLFDRNKEAITAIAAGHTPEAVFAAKGMGHLLLARSTMR